MNETARVLELEILQDLRGALEVFSQDAQTALETVDAEIRRVENWLQEQITFWQTEIRRCEEAVFLAKQELARKEMMKIGDRPVDCTEELKRLQIAKARLEFAQEKIATTRKWLRDFPNELIEYQGPSRLLKSILETDVRKVCSLLESKLDSLEGYTNLPSPSTDPNPLQKERKTQN